jgi:aryl-alcohol dehydrogenase-like predicted oxidoreductase
MMQAPRTTLGGTDLAVSRLALGTMTMGSVSGDTESLALLDHAFEHGIDFFDTAEMYPIPVDPGTVGRTDALIGRWMRERGNRDRVTLCAKVVAAPSEQAIMGANAGLTYMRDGEVGLSRPVIRRAVDETLRRLQTDHLDLLQPHWPDRHTNAMRQLGFTESQRADGAPIAETLATMGELVQEGKVRAVGVSNETAWGVSQYLCAAERGLGPRIITVQNAYNLLSRSYETALSEFAHRERVDLMAYCPLGMGTLTGKYLDNRSPVAGRLTRHPHPRFTSGQAVEATRQYVELARAHGIDPALMAHAFVLSRPFVAASVFGASRVEHIDLALQAAAVELSPEVLEGIDGIHGRIPNPGP